MSKPRRYKRCAEHSLQAITTVDGEALCYACVVCLLYADTDTKELAEMLGSSARAISRVAHKHGVYKSAEYLATHDCGRIKPGNVPHNKGCPRRPGWAPGRMAETQFKRGCRTGVAKKNWQPVGSIRPDADGYLRIKVREWRRGDAFGFGNTEIWPRLARHVWEQHHGQIPAGHAVVFKDRNRSNCDPGNLELVTRRELMLRNSVHNLPPDLRQVIQLNGALKRVIRRLGEKQDVGSAQPFVRDARSA